MKQGEGYSLLQAVANRARLARRVGRLAVVVAAGVAVWVVATWLGGGLRGTVTSVDDAGLGSFALGGGWVAAVPAGTAPDVVVNDELALEEDPDRAAVAIDRSALHRAGGQLAEVSGGGRFSLDVPPGDYVLCLVRGGGMSVYGCSEATLPEAGRIRLTWGEGGLGVLVEE